MNKKLNKLFKIFFVIIFILSTLVATAYGVNENNNNEENNEQNNQDIQLPLGEMIVESEHLRNYPDGSYIPFEHLDSFYDVFCCQHGTALPSSSQTRLEGSNGDVLPYSYPYLTQNDIGKKIGVDKTKDPYDSSEYTNKTIGRYRIEKTEIAKPKEAYILSEMIKVDGIGEYNPAQIAWWTSEAGKEGNNIEPNALALEADAFEAYILEVSGITNRNDVKYKTAEFITKEGEHKKIDNAFDFNYEANWVDEGEFANPTVVWDAEAKKFTVGPFALDYVGSTEQFGDREEVQFAGIESMELYTDASDKPLEFGKDWEFVWAEGERTDASDSKYPMANEKFYIRMNYIDEATKITNIKTKFKYMNAAGVYQKLKGTYFIAHWDKMSQYHKEPQRDKEDKIKTDDEGNILYNVYTEYWLELTSLQEFPSQKLALGINGARWYEYLEVDRRINIRSGKIKIQKDVVDGYGDKVQDDDSFFTFDVEVNGAINGGSSKIKVKAGKSATTKEYYWLEGSAAPTYTVTENDADGYKQAALENATGSLEDTKTVVVKAENISEKHAKLKIVKIVDPKIINGQEVNLDGKTFNFNVSLSGDFYYDGNKHLAKDEPLNLVLPVTIKGNRGEIETSYITWFGKTAPTYNIEEVPSEFAKVISITPSSGSLVNDTTIEVTAHNDITTEKGKLHIIKTLENAEKYSEEEIMKLKFNFEIDVDGYEKIKVSLTPVRKDNNYVWEYTTGYYEWTKGNNPKYTITEVDNPAGTKFVNATSEDVDVTVNGQSVSGVLVSDESKDFEVTNNIINTIDKPNTGRIELTKYIDEDILKNKEFRFAVTVTSKGPFTYEGVEYPAGTRIQLVNEEGNNTAIIIGEDGYDDKHFVTIVVGDAKKEVWTSGEFTWYGESAPEYKVEENLLSEDFKSSVEPSKGFLTDRVEGSDVVKVSAWNRGITLKAGYIHIIKTLENADKYSVDYIKSLVFKFKIHVDGYEDYVVSLKPEKKGNSYVWEYTSNAFTWKETEEAPKYTITEIELPEGTEFVSAESEHGTAIENGIEGTLVESKTQDVLITTDNSFINKVNENSGDLIVEKQVKSEALKGKEFKFKVTIKGAFEYKGVTYGPASESETYVEEITVNGGSQWKSETIKWYGEVAPTYTVEEFDSEIAENVSVINASGTIKKDTSVVATFVNDSKKTGGYLEITKLIESGVATKDKFKFKVSIEGMEPFYVEIGANEKYRSNRIVWNVGEKAPSYSVEEVDIPDGAELVRIDNASGELLPDDQVVSVVAVNKYEERSGKFQVTKEIIADLKLLDGKVPEEFTIVMTVSGTFEMNGESVVDSTREIKTTLKANETYTSPEIKWWGNNAPVVNVSEINLSKGWHIGAISNNGASLEKDQTIEFVVTNVLSTRTVIDLTIQLAGDVWEDIPLDENDKNTSNSVENGKMDDSERRIAGVEVYIYDNNGNLVPVYDDGAEIEQPIITTESGHWEAPSVKILKDGQYDIEFVYDGQTYEPTKFLTTSNGDANAYRSASTAERDNWAKDSMALDLNRSEVNARIQEVKGKSPIDGNGKTVGTVVGPNGENTVTYDGAKNALANGSTRIKSKVNTLNADGTAKELFKTKARTSVGGLTYPFDQKTHLESYDTYIDELGLVQYYRYSATYNYTLHINLGLKKRPEADLGTTKDLVSANVVAKDNLNKYKFNKLEDIGSDCYSRQLYKDSNEIEYQLGLYSTDYYYRAEMYQANNNVAGTDAVETFYKDLGQTMDDTEMDIFLKYRISLYNESSDYIVKVNSVDDYFDSSFGAPINTTVERYVKTINGEENEGKVVVAEPSTTSNGKNVAWTVTNKDILGSDGVTYNKMTAQGLDLELKSGERVDIFVTFALNKENIKGNEDTIELGDKSNVAEISSYQTLTLNGENAGKLDRDSAPGNVNVKEYNDREWYEDDTDAAPTLKLVLEDEARTVNGTAWEDKSESELTSVGNGKMDKDEAVIGGMTTQLVEKVTLKQDDNNVEYDFVWPTNKQLDVFGGKTLNYLTGFDSTIETARKSEEEGLQVGGYEFEGVPTGNYVVRFLYGNNKLDLDDTENITGDPQAYKQNGELWDEDNIFTANYDKDVEGRTTAVYNGQDYKSTIYQNYGGDNTLENQDYDLNNEELSKVRVSDAKDNESRRLNVISKSETITNANGTVLATANDAAAKHTGLYEDYSMFADTAKIKLNVEDLKDSKVNKESEIQGTILESGTVRVDKEGTTYHVDQVDVGLVERPETRLVLDKQIGQIKLTTNDQRVIFNADYDIQYKKVPNIGLDSKTVIARYGNEALIAEPVLKDSSVGIDLMQSIDKSEYKLENEIYSGQQNFRYVNVDDTILQGTTLEINYLITALNVGEVDKTSEIIDNISNRDFAKVSELTKLDPRTPKEAYMMLADYAAVQAAHGNGNVGEILGKTYYVGNVDNYLDENNEKTVMTRVRQVVDYIDNDAVYSQEFNNETNASWKNTTINELKGNGYEADKLLAEEITTEYNLVDKNGMSYINNQRNNVVLSVDNFDAEQPLNNAGFEAKLKPYNLDKDYDEDSIDYKSNIKLKITRTVSAQDDAKNLAFDNLAEIVKVENTAGRRDVIAIPGNANPHLGEFEIALQERDSSATELVTFTPPTGINSNTIMTFQVLAIVLVALTIVLVGVIIIKKKVLK